MFMFLSLGTDFALPRTRPSVGHGAWTPWSKDETELKMKKKTKKKSKAARNSKTKKNECAIDGPVRSPNIIVSSRVPMIRASRKD